MNFIFDQYTKSFKKEIKLSRNPIDILLLTLYCVENITCILMANLKKKPLVTKMLWNQPLSSDFLINTLRKSENWIKFSFVKWHSLLDFLGPALTFLSFVLLSICWLLLQILLSLIVFVVRKKKQMNSNSADNRAYLYSLNFRTYTGLRVIMAPAILAPKWIHS